MERVRPRTATEEGGQTLRIVGRLLAAQVLMLCILAASFLPASSALAQNQGALPPIRVDLELVLAVDVSQSMTYDEHELQRSGYVDAFRHKDVINAVTAGPEGRIAVMYMEWAGDFEPIPLITWTIIDGEKSAKAFADRLAEAPINGEQRTSISRALYTAAEYIETNSIASHRRVIDVSGDGANNAGPPVEAIRDDVLSRDIIVNGLPIMLNKPREFYDIDHLDRYYKDCVIGGPAAFIAPVFDLRHFAATIRKKLVLEIAGIDIAPPGSAPVQFAEAPPEGLKGEQPVGLTRIQLKLPTTKTDCMIGEKVWMNRGWGRYGGFGDLDRR